MTIKNISASDALRNRRLDTKKSMRFPLEGDERVVEGLILPHIKPNFKIPTGGTVFTIGSCFAREIEQEIFGVNVPTKEVTFQSEVVTGRGNSILNEFNPACMAQRINWAIEGRDTREFPSSLAGSDHSARDLLLAKGNALDKISLLDIRRQIDDVYGSLDKSDVLILTLGMTYVWQDLETMHYLNRMPDPRAIKKEPNRYQYLCLDTESVVDLLSEAIENSLKTNIQNILLTVSPVPLQGTFFLGDCAIANGLSKSVLRCAVDELSKTFPERVDYFPSYEIVTSGGLQSFSADHVHVKKEVVKHIMDHMLNYYMNTSTTEKAA